MGLRRTPSRGEDAHSESPRAPPPSPLYPQSATEDSTPCPTNIEKRQDKREQQASVTQTKSEGEKLQGDTNDAKMNFSKLLAGRMNLDGGPPLPSPAYPPLPDYALRSIRTKTTFRNDDGTVSIIRSEETVFRLMRRNGTRLTRKVLGDELGWTNPVTMS